MEISPENKDLKQYPYSHRDFHDINLTELNANNELKVTSVTLTIA